MNIKKLENMFIQEIFKKLRDKPETKDREILYGELIKWKELLPNDKVKKKISCQRIADGVIRLQEEYNDEVMKQQKSDFLKEFVKYRIAIHKSIVQWRMGLYRDLTRENILDYVLSMETFIHRLASCYLDTENLRKFNIDSKIYVAPYPNDIIETLNQSNRIIITFSNLSQIVIRDEKNFETYNKLLSMSKGIYDAIEILIGKKPVFTIFSRIILDISLSPPVLLWLCQ